MSQHEQLKDLAYSALLLERQLDSYQKLHEEEIVALRKALAELKTRILAIAPPTLESALALEEPALALEEPALALAQAAPPEQRQDARISQQ